MKFLRFTSFITLFVVLLTVLGFYSPASGKSKNAVTHTFAPRIRLKNGSSLNWAGYAVETSLTNPSNNAVSDVTGSWVVPTLNTNSNPCSSTSTYSATWLGIDGYNDNTVEQTGTEQDCINGQPRYYAWYEMYPHPSYVIRGVAINPGDTMTAEVKYSGRDYFTLTVMDTTTQKSFTTTQKSKGHRQSAKWIVEAPYSGGILPLANFGTQNFTNAGLTLNGIPGNISTVGQYDAITMEDSSGTLKAVPSSLSNGGTSFSVQWHNSN